MKATGDALAEAHAWLRSEEGERAVREVVGAFTRANATGLQRFVLLNAMLIGEAASALVEQEEDEA